MPPVSKAQSRFMRAVASGEIKKPGLSKSQAQEYVQGYPTKELPEYAPSHKTQKRAKKLLPLRKRTE